MIDVRYKGPTGGDETAPYYVNMDKEYTVGEFISDIIANQGKKEWGSFNIYKDDYHIDNRISTIHYNYGTLENIPDINIVNSKIKKASASGGWTRMDYMILI